MDGSPIAVTGDHTRGGLIHMGAICKRLFDFGDSLRFVGLVTYKLNVSIGCNDYRIWTSCAISLASRRLNCC
jgi:hypothetical protein